MHHKRVFFWTTAALVALSSPGCGTSEQTMAVSKLASPDSPEFHKAQEDANRTLQRQEQDEARLRKRRKLPQDE
ncbi:hypothetical protein GC170_15300 [bacterium]|nr:hypothetical protein [bacterium]